MNILTQLSSKEYISGEILAETLGVSRAAVHKRICKLREQGYRIIGGKNRGYRIVSRPDILLPEEVMSRMAQGGDSWRFVYEMATSSTQTIAKELAGRNDTENTVVLAERQTGGYGRFQRQWSSPQGGIWCSLVLRPAVSPEHVHFITFIISICVCRALERVAGVTALIKWPNDIVVNNKKLAGILVEMSAEIGRVNWVVAGIGINVNNTLPETLKASAASLKTVTGKKYPRAAILAAFLEEYESSLPLFVAGGFDAFRDEYCHRFWLQDTPVSVQTGQETITGIVNGIDTDGALLLKTPEKGVRRIIAGTIVKQ